MERRPEVRVGDRERREVDERLRAAQDEGMLTLVEYDERARACYLARFRHELDELLVDLPAPPAAAPPTREVVPDDAGPAAATSSAGGRLRGWWGNLAGLAVAGVLAYAVLEADQGAAVFGDRTVAVAPGQTEVEVGVLFGSVTVVVPDGVRATTSGITVFGSTSCAEACAAGGPGAAQVEVSGRGAFGSVEVLSAGEAARGVELRGDRDDDRDD